MDHTHRSARRGRRAVSIARAGLVGLLAAGLLSGCTEGSLADLESFVQETLARPGKRPEELPPIEPYVTYFYPCQIDTCSDPFKPFYVEERASAATQARVDNGIKPDTNRLPEELESYALDSLRMLGTLEKGPENWAIVRSPDAIIHRVQVGNFMGRNHGKIIGITETGIELVEIVPDGQGGWIEREASLALIE
ncbi:MAG: pilus assembly protein PilP [Ectothiorhodospiraceae bacterium]|nr:pilus assembly protein PilP [Chromatiales bacterium]MCP5156471.1 pilus assembly protein PilP [Ectothiorhodospiraceae bacterium]